jgi:hypothetical protein
MSKNRNSCKVTHVYIKMIPRSIKLYTGLSILFKSTSTSLFTGGTFY